MIIEIKNILNEINTDLKGENRSVWTKTIKQRLAELGNSLDCKTCASGIDSDTGEFLFDLILYQGDNLLNSIELAMECEWNRSLGSIYYDFEKLLTTNAKQRLLICQASSENVEELRNKFKAYISNYSLLKQGSKFLIAIWIQEDEKFKYIELQK